MDTRFKPLPYPGATKVVNRYAVVIPQGTRGPIAITTAVYYQSVEAIVALKFLGNMADTNGNFVLEPCVLGGLCDRRKPASEPPVVEGAPPVPMIVRSRIIAISGSPLQKEAPQVATYPLPDGTNVYRDAVVKVFTSRPLHGIDATSFILTDSHGTAVPALVDQIGAGAWGLFPGQVILKPGERYTARLKRGICDDRGNCTTQDTSWSFTTAPEGVDGDGDTAVPVAFSIDVQKHPSYTSRRHARDTLTQAGIVSRKRDTQQ
jgi:hypothetical protein